jgi:hypothetical protein
MLDVGKTAAKQLNYRTYQYGMKRETWNLQGGGRWFEPSIAHQGKAAFCRENAAHHNRVRMFQASHLRCLLEGVATLPLSGAQSFYGYICEFVVVEACSRAERIVCLRLAPRRR